MKSRVSILPGMAVNNIRKNGRAYFPYIGVSIFAMFTYFVFDLILKSDVMLKVPKAAYASALVMVGFYLLGIIMVPFLYYTNSFLIKRRKRELGLYSILGMEKKHIGIMMFWESLIVYGIVTVGAVLLGLLFSKLIFLLLLNLVELPVDSALRLSPAAFLDLFSFYGIVTGLNLFVNLIQVGKARPVELMSESKKGEKEPKHIGVLSLAGVLLLGRGYYIALTSSLNGDIFTKFFLAVFLVVAGTYFLFTAGSIAFLRFLKRRKRYYYRAENFVTVSGMLYRMKKSAASLSNICVFSTMVIITVICTVGVGLSMDFITDLMYPRECSVTFLGPQNEEALCGEFQDIARRTGVELADYLSYGTVPTVAFQDGNVLREEREDDVLAYYNVHDVEFCDLDSYNLMENARVQLAPDEVLVYSSGADFGFGKILLDGTEYTVKEELERCSIRPKAEGDIYYTRYLVVLPDEEDVIRIAASFGMDGTANRVFHIAANPRGGEEAADAFSGRRPRRLRDGRALPV
ncbi:MAG: FtsX-like permease family protein [bacterium]|nr:FtsX-like permease family protein [bacterium]